MMSLIIRDPRQNLNGIYNISQLMEIIGLIMRNNTIPLEKKTQMLVMEF